MPFRLVSMVISRMTLDLRAFSRSGGWFAAWPDTAPVTIMESAAMTDSFLWDRGASLKPSRTGDIATQDSDESEDIDYTISELLLMRTPRTPTREFLELRTIAFQSYETGPSTSRKSSSSLPSV